MMKKLAVWMLFGVLFFAGSQSLKAQYGSAIGARLGSYLGLTFKHNFDSQSAFEGIFETRYRGISVTGLYEYHIPIDAVDGLRFYFGGGAHFGYWSEARGNTIWGNVPKGAYSGLDLILGLEYTFDSAPINLSFDYKPMFQFTRYTNRLGYDNGALSIRYVF